MRDGRLETATMEIDDTGKTRQQVRREIAEKEAAVQGIAKQYCKQGDVRCDHTPKRVRRHTLARDTICTETWR